MINMMQLEPLLSYHGVPAGLVVCAGLTLCLLLSTQSSSSLAYLSLSCIWRNITETAKKNLKIVVPYQELFLP